MMRFLWLFFLFLFPFMIFAFYIKLCDLYGKERPIQKNIISKVIIIGLSLCIVFLIGLRFFSTDNIKKGVFVPSYEKDGKIIPSHFK